MFHFLGCVERVEGSGETGTTQFRVPVRKVKDFVCFVQGQSPRNVNDKTVRPCEQETCMRTNQGSEGILTTNLK